MPEGGVRNTVLILAKAEECGISKRTIDAAKKTLGVQSEKTPDGWFWSLPDAKDARLQECKDTENLQPCNVEQGV